MWLFIYFLSAKKTGRPMAADHRSAPCLAPRRLNLDSLYESIRFCQAAYTHNLDGTSQQEFPAHRQSRRPFTGRHSGASHRHYTMICHSARSGTWSFFGKNPKLECEAGFCGHEDFLDPLSANPSAPSCRNPKDVR